MNLNCWRIEIPSDVSLMLSICDIACHHGSSLPLWISEMSITNAIMVKS